MECGDESLHSRGVQSMMVVISLVPPGTFMGSEAFERLVGWCRPQPGRSLRSASGAARLRLRSG